MPSKQQTHDNTELFEPIRLTLRNIMTIVYICLGGFVFTLVAVFCAYLLACYLDDRTPFTMHDYSAKNMVLNGKIQEHFDGTRLRACEISIYRYAVDAKGRTIFEKKDERPISGVVSKRVTLDNEYTVHPRTVTGPATLHIYYRWICPNNLVQRYYHPLEKEYTANFYIYSTQEELDNANKKEKDND